MAQRWNIGSDAVQHYAVAGITDAYCEKIYFKNRKKNKI